MGVRKCPHKCPQHRRNDAEGGAVARPRNLGYGEGTVYFEKSTNRWRGELRLATGERRRVSGATRSDVTTELDKLRIKIANGQTLGDDTRLDQWIEWWVDTVWAKKTLHS